MLFFSSIDRCMELETRNTHRSYILNEMFTKLSYLERLF